MSLNELVLYVVGLVAILLAITVLISYLAYRVKQNERSPAGTKLVTSFAGSSLQAGPASITYHPELFRIERNLPVRESSPNRRMHPDSESHPVRFTVVNSNVIGESYNPQYFMPRELRRVG